ncbi:MAG: oligosaccharide flippase family protein [Deltaproteobacteria bacterium]|nr:oligosaccharide flippase family protein [Deltaproteobacteria bacterium]
MQCAIDSDFVRKVTETFATRIFLIGIGLVTGVIVARILGPEGRGLYGVAVTIGAIGVQFGNMGLHASNTYYVARDRELLAPLVGNILLVGLVFGGIISVLAGALFYIYPHIAPLDGLLLTLALVYIPLGLTYMLLQSLLLGIQEVRIYNKIDIINSFFTFCLVGIVIAIGIVSVESVFAMGLVALFIGCVWIMRLLLTYTDSPPLPSLSLFRNNISYGLKAYFSSLFVFLMLRIDLLMIKYILGAEEAGHYSIAVNMADMVYMLPLVVSTILYPKLSAIKNVHEKWRYTKNVLVVLGLVMFAICIFFALFSHVIVGLLVGKVYLPAVPAFVVLIPAIYLLSLGGILGNFNASVMIPPSSIPFTLGLAILNILLNLVLIERYGIVGASVSSMICYGLLIPFNVYYVKVYLSRADELSSE